jgi:ferredoxin-NADP reductase
LGVKIIYTASDPRHVPPGWKGWVGHISPQLIGGEIPDYLDCVFYISGPPALVDSFRVMLSAMHVRADHIKTDRFAGLA